MTIKNFSSNDPGLFMTSHQDSYGGQDLKISAGYEMKELLDWWRQWKEIMKNQHPSVQDAIQQVKVVHELSKEQPKTITYPNWTETTL